MKPKGFYNIVNRILDAMYSEKCALIFFEQLRQKRTYLIKIFIVCHAELVFVSVCSSEPHTFFVENDITTEEHYSLTETKSTNLLRILSTKTTKIGSFLTEFFEKEKAFLGSMELDLLSFVRSCYYKRINLLMKLVAVVRFESFCSL